jgi:hypothetical protein
MIATLTTIYKPWKQADSGIVWRAKSALMRATRNAGPSTTAFGALRAPNFALDDS